MTKPMGALLKSFNLCPKFSKNEINLGEHVLGWKQSGFLTSKYKEDLSPC